MSLGNIHETAQVHASNEQLFIKRDAHNRGHLIVPRMIVNCLKLSAGAKTAYEVIVSFVEENGYSSFPSMIQIAHSCDYSVKTAYLNIKELVDKGFVHKKRLGNRRTNVYYMEEMSKVNHLQVSEMFWRAHASAKAQLEVKLHDKLYESFAELTNSIGKEGTRFSDLPVNKEKEDSIIKTLLSKVREDAEMFNPPNRRKAVPETGEVAKVVVKIEADGVSTLATRSTPSILTGNNRFILPDETSKWTNDHFVQYFYEKYLDVTGRTHESARPKHRGMIGRCIKSVEGEKELIKKRIDSFFQMGYELPTLEVFCTSGRAAEIELFIEKGKKPFYLEAQSKKELIETTEQTKSGMSTEDFLKRITGGSK